MSGRTLRGGRQPPDSTWPPSARRSGRSAIVTRGAHAVNAAVRGVKVVVDEFVEDVQTQATNPPAAAGLPLNYLAKSLAKLLETARRELDSNRETAKASLVTASSILQSEIERGSGANGSRPGALAGWQIARVRAFIEENLHSNIDAKDLSAVAQRSPAHFARSFKQAFGEPPHAYVIKRRLERACHLMVTTSESLSEIALGVGLTDHAHLSKLFQRAFGQSPSIWRREHEVQGSISRAGMREERLIDVRSDDWASTDETTGT
jgi:AraC family transcriptional regulator